MPKRYNVTSRNNAIVKAVSISPKKKHELKVLFGYARTYRLNKRLQALQGRGLIKYVPGKGFVNSTTAPTGRA